MSSTLHIVLRLSGKNYNSHLLINNWLWHLINVLLDWIGNDEQTKDSLFDL